MRALLLVTLLAACSEKNPYYCPGSPDNNCVDADINMPMGCTTSAQCTNSAKPICDTTQDVCVACTADEVGACSGTTPVCSATNTCTSCTAHAQCDSAACLPDGSCAMESQVAYVSANGDDANPCSPTQPCKTITASATKKPYVKVTGELEEAVLLDGVSVTVLGDVGAAVQRSTQGPVFDLRGTSTITIRDLTIRGGLGTTGHGVLIGLGEPVNATLDRVAIIGNGGTGVVALGSATLTMSRCVVSANVGGGAKIESSYSVSNSLFVRNGSGSSSFGGLFLNPTGTTSFKFNTVANNVAASTPRGITCVPTISGSSSIISTNEVSANCQFEYSLFDPAVNVSGTNRAGEPRFKSVDVNSPLAADYFRIQAASEAVDQADPASTMMTDIDGDARPQGNAPDIGADEAL